MNISSAVGGYVHFASVQPKPSQSQPAGTQSGRDGRTSGVPQQSTRPTAAKGVNLSV